MGGGGSTLIMGGGGSTLIMGGGGSTLLMGGRWSVSYWGEGVVACHLKRNADIKEKALSGS